jgi:hypothetical protein
MFYFWRTLDFATQDNMIYGLSNDVSPCLWHHKPYLAMYNSLFLLAIRFIFTPLLFTANSRSKLG